MHRTIQVFFLTLLLLVGPSSFANEPIRRHEDLPSLTFEDFIRDVDVITEGFSGRVYGPGDFAILEDDEPLRDAIVTAIRTNGALQCLPLGSEVMKIVNSQSSRVFLGVGKIWIRLWGPQLFQEISRIPVIGPSVSSRFPVERLVTFLLDDNGEITNWYYDRAYFRVQVVNDGSLREPDFRYEFQRTTRNRYRCSSL